MSANRQDVDLELEAAWNEQTRSLRSDEHFRMKDRLKFYESISEMQEDLEIHLEYCNNDR